MERNHIIIIAALAAAFFILRRPSAPATSTAQAAATGTGTAPAAAAPSGGTREPYSWEVGSSQTTPEEARWPYAYLTPSASTGNSPTQDPVAATGGYTPMPKIPMNYA